MIIIFQLSFLKYDFTTDNKITVSKRTWRRIPEDLDDKTRQQAISWSNSGPVALPGNNELTYLFRKTIQHKKGSK